MRHYHIHRAATEGKEMRAWYTEHFFGINVIRIGQLAVQLPGINLTCTPPATEMLATNADVLDYIVFEIDVLEEICEGLQDKRIGFYRGDTLVLSLSLGVAFFTDPWGAYIEPQRNWMAPISSWP
jgi:hypothetical protein